MKVSDLLRRDIAPFLYGAFLSRIMEERIGNTPYFYCYASFRISTAVPERVFRISTYGRQYIDELNFISGVHDWKLKKCTDSGLEARLYVENDLRITKTSFFSMLYSKFMQSSWLHDEHFNDDKKDFIRGFIELRGSIDTTAKFIAQDYFFNNRVELKKALVITDFMNVPIKYANYNMRDLQYQFVAGINKRNPQFRIHSYFYAKEIGFLNKYKAKIFETAFPTNGTRIENGIQYFDVVMPKSTNDDVAFIKYLNFFSNHVYERSLTSQAVEELRRRLGFPSDSDLSVTGRDRSIIEIFDMIAPDKCAICGIETTHTRPNGRQYFEIHHVISRCNGAELDNIANLVKLCPTCHHMMKRNGSTKEEQVNAIIKILNEHNEIFEFCSSYLDIADIVDLANKIQDLLG